MNLSVALAHVPYRHRGGEDEHVATLQGVYRDLGATVRLVPADRDPRSYSLLDRVLSLAPGPGTTGGLNDVDIVHVHNLFPVLGPRFLRRIVASGKPILWTIHNHRLYCTNGLAMYGGQRCEICKTSPSAIRPIVRNCNRNIVKSTYYGLAVNLIRRGGLLGAVDRFLAPSPYIAAELASFGIPGPRIALMPNPVLGPMEALRRRPPAPRPTVLYAGRLSEEKGVRLLPDVAAACPDFDVEVYGDGPLAADLARRAAGLANLRLRGLQPNHVVLAALESANAAILPSTCDEICPTFAIEALARGVPLYLVPTRSTAWFVEQFGARPVAAWNGAEFARAVRASHAEPPDPVVVDRVRRTFSRAAYAAALLGMVTDLMDARGRSPGAAEGAPGGTG